MRGMIADAIFLLDYDRHTRCRPGGSAKAKRFSPFCQQERQVGQVLRLLFRWSTWRRVMTQGFWTLGSAFGDPLTHRSFRDSQGHGDVFLFPSLLVQFPGA